MNWNRWVRQAHRWISILFTLMSAGIFVALGFGQEPAEWVYMMPLLPLFLLVVSGLYMFALPYLARRTAS